MVCSSVSRFTSHFTPQFSLLTPHSSPTNISSSSRPHSHSQLVPTRPNSTLPAKIAPATAALRFAWALQEDLISFGSQKETPLGPRTRSRAALLCCLTSPRSLAHLILHRNQPALALPPSFHLPIAERRLVSNTFSSTTPPPPPPPPPPSASSSIATFYNCTFDLLGRATHSVVVVAVSSSHAHSFSDGLRAARSKAQRSSHQ